jgi:hypothetical protein
MEKKVQKRFSRLEPADHFAALSRQLRRGRLEVHGRSWTVPQEVDACLRYG